MKKWLSFVFCLMLFCVCFFVAMPTAYAVEVSSSDISLDLAVGCVEIYESEGVTYCVQNSVTQATTGGVILRQTKSSLIATTNTVRISSGTCKLSIVALNIEAFTPIAVREAAALELVLVSDNTLKATSGAGIEVPYGASLTIGGTGSAVITGSYRSAGVGGGQYGYCGAVTINSGTITVTSGSSSAGIGGGYQARGGTVTINGGIVEVYGDGGAGIGGGVYGDGRAITINGGTVTATSSSGAGIGGGECGSCGEVIINGGTVVASGRGSGIGNGLNDGDAGGTVSINGGTVTVASIGAVDAVIISEEAIVTSSDGKDLTVNENIYIDTQPLPAVAHLGNIPALSVSAHNHSGLHYQWQTPWNSYTWIDFKGETSETATFVMTEKLNGSYIRCKLTNAWGNVVYTDPVQLYVLAFAKQPTSVEANLNDVVVFDAQSTCANVTYQWQRSYDDGSTWGDVPGETYSTLILNTTLSESSTKYRCVITATNGDQLASDEVSVNLDFGDMVTYTVQHFQQDADGSGYSLMSQQVMEGTSGSSVTAPATIYEGFTENTKKSTISGTVASDSSLVLTRYFDRNTYSIIFNMNGGSELPHLEALYGASIQAPGTPSRYGYIFDGWYADEELTEKYVFDTMPLNGATVYAKWLPVGSDRGIEYAINSLAIRDSNTLELLDGIPTDSFLVEVSVTNLEATETDTILLVYYTNKGQMIGMNYMFANTPVGYTATFGASVDNKDGNMGIIKAFVLPALGTPVALAEAKSIGE